MAKMRTIQPPHASEKFTLAEARRAWRVVEAAKANAAGQRSAARRPRSVRLDCGDAAKLAAEHGRDG